MNRLFATLVSLLCGSALAGCGFQDDDDAKLYRDEIDYDTFVPVAVIDPAQAERAAALLDQVGIPNLVEGSVAYGVSVPPELKAKAVAVLKADAEAGRYTISF